MASDRGTLSRGSGLGADQQSPWVAPTMPADRRMPSAPRERKPLLVVLALLLIVVGAGAAGLLVIKAGHRVGAIEISQNVGLGQQIQLNDMQEVQVASDTGVNYVPWASASQVARLFAAMQIPAGTLLTPSMVAASDNLVNGRDELGLALKDGQFPANLEPGQPIMIYSTAQNSGGCPGTPGSTLASDATVISIIPGHQGTGQTDVVVAVDPAAAGRVACNAANGAAAVGVMPGNAAG